MRTVLRIGWLPRRWLSTNSQSSAENNKGPTAVQRFHIGGVTNKDVPIEKQSLTRGLAMDKFEKDFFIYPEHQDTEDLRNIEGFVKMLHDSLEVSVNSEEIEKLKALTENVKLAIDRNAIPSTLVPGTFGGLGFSNKDKIRLFEELSIDWSLCSSIEVINRAVNLLLTFGSVQQKEKYLPLISEGKCRPGFAVLEQGGAFAEVCGSGDNQLLDGKVKVVNPQSANLLFVFGAKFDKNEKRRQITCYLIDRNEIDDSTMWEAKREETLGLRAFEIGELHLRAFIQSSNVLGEESKGLEVANELSACSRIPLSAAVSGFAKRLIDDLVTVCNQTASTSTENATLSDLPAIQRVLSHLTTKVYALESSTYYLGGLMDEGLSVTIDIESALLHRQSREVLSLCVSTIVELCGLQGSKLGVHYERWIRDISTLLAMHPEGSITEQVALSTISTWAAKNFSRTKSTFQRLFNAQKYQTKMANPGLRHYIAEHAHPTLQLACQELENSMGRVNVIIEKLLSERGKNLEADYGTMENLVRVLQNNFMMVAVIARATRSYSIGLRNADLEILFASQLCTRLARSSWFELQALGDHFGLLRTNPGLLQAGRAIFDIGGYKLENPIEKMW
ncbi:unnamed protein product, partial [Mesorhabditis belari]|uniref:Uncharacterized protein n=1 Tax=Mesorhabditis belari TaxID=2138241 RepID=A0AAF3FBH9_9BILA